MKGTPDAATAAAIVERQFVEVIAAPEVEAAALEERRVAGIDPDHQVVDIDAQLLGVNGVEGVLRVDEGRDAAPPLRLRDDVEGDGGLARALGSEDLDDAAPGDPADTERDVEREGTGRDDRDAGTHRVLPELHHGALAVLLLDLRERDVEHLVPVHRSLLSSPPGTRPAGRERARSEDAIPCL